MSLGGSGVSIGGVGSLRVLLMAEIRRSPVDMVVFPIVYIIGFIYPRCFDHFWAKYELIPKPECFGHFGGIPLAKPPFARCFDGFFVI